MHIAQPNETQPREKQKPVRQKLEEEKLVKPNMRRRKNWGTQSSMQKLYVSLILIVMTMVDIKQ